MTEQIIVDGIVFQGIRLLTAKGTILLIQGGKANLGCGYFSLKPAEQLQDRFAIVKGVKSFEDMLNAVVAEASSAAQSTGVKTGSTPGREALLRMEREA